MFEKIKLYFQNIVANIRQRRLINYYEKLIRRGWKINLQMKDENKKIDQAIALMEAEEKLAYWKQEYSIQ